MTHADQPDLGQHSLDTAAVRADFPIFDGPVNGRDLIYLDSSGTSQKPRQVQCSPFLMWNHM